MKTNTRILTACMVIFLIGTPCAKSTAKEPQRAAKERLTGKRLFWDRATLKQIFSSGNYARMIQLKDGSLVAVAESGGNTKISRSFDSGATWSGPTDVAVRSNNISQSVPEILELSNGNLLVTYNPRPGRPYTTDRKFGIRAKLSSDKGQTWSDEIFVFDAQHTFHDGCWEPVQMELPSGEIQLYFANENDFQTSDEQNISMCRSFDGGKTWSHPEVICFRAGHRDGMPVPIFLEDKSEIIVAIEDNGCDGFVKFRPSIIRTSLKDNWQSGSVDGNNLKRENPFADTLDKSHNYAAPYIRRLGSGEVLLSYQGSEGRQEGEQFQQMFVWIGDKEGRNLKYKTAPFNTPLSKQGNWNSVSVIDDNVAVALTSTNLTSNHNEIWMIKGYPIESIDVQKFKASADICKKIPVGSQCNTSGYVDMRYDNKNLYIYARINDNDIISADSDPEKCDGITLYIDAEGVSSEKPSQGIYSISIGTNGRITANKGINGEWKSMSASSAQCNVSTSSGLYHIEAAIPWKMLGTHPDRKTDMAATVKLRCTSGTENQSEMFTGTDANAPYTWMKLNLK